MKNLSWTFFQWPARLYVDKQGTAYPSLEKKDELRKKIRFYVNSQWEATESLEYLQEKTKNDVNNVIKK